MGGAFGRDRPPGAERHPCASAVGRARMQVQHPRRLPRLQRSSRSGFPASCHSRRSSPRSGPLGQGWVQQVRRPSACDPTVMGSTVQMRRIHRSSIHVWCPITVMTCYQDRTSKPRRPQRDPTIHNLHPRPQKRMQEPTLIPGSTFPQALLHPSLPPFHDHERRRKALLTRSC